MSEMPPYAPTGEPDEKPDRGRVEQRAADLLPEERAAGTDDAETEAEILLEDSDRRTEDASE